MKITDDIRYLGVNDHEIDLFEGQYPVPHGVSYNSYAILDQKTAVLDTVDRRFTDFWLANVRALFQGKAPDYLIVHHVEPDHAANVARFLEEYPSTTVVASAKAFTMLKNFFGKDYEDRRVVVREGSVLELGKHTLTFVAAPMVHWPEVMVSYDACDKVLFSADGFGKFGALDIEEPWDDEARRYFIGIVGKYGPQVQMLLKKASTLDIQKICPLHGPVLTEDLSHYLALYDTWSSYRPETSGITIAYTSVYGHTKDAVTKLVDALKDQGVQKIALYDLARCDISQAVADAFRYDRLVLATTTYNMDIFPFMRSFIEHLTERNFQNRTVALIENGSWAPVAAKTMTALLASSKDLHFTTNFLTIHSALSQENLTQLTALAQELAAN
jgi:flavorubredoxin